MSSLLRSAAVAVSMYSRIPMPQFEWDQKDMRYAFCFFPLVGVLIGAVWSIWIWVSRILGIGLITSSAVLVLIPILMTGGIHLDGFLDTVDARSSWRTKEERIRILKDSHTGAFAVIGFGVYLLASFALASEVFQLSHPYAVCVIPALARTASGYATTHIRNMNPEGTAASFTKNLSRRAMTISGFCYLAGAAVFELLYWKADGLLTAVILTAVSILGYRLFRFRAIRDFGGINGDLAGYFLSVLEPGLAFALVLTGRITG